MISGEISKSIKPGERISRPEFGVTLMLISGGYVKDDIVVGTMQNMVESGQLVPEGNRDGEMVYRRVVRLP